MDTRLKVLFTCSCFVFMLPLHVVISTRVSMALQHDEVERYLATLNKPFVMSIKSPDGDIIDCVLLAQQPAFDDPILKNHTIQMRPSYYPEEKESNEETVDEPKFQLWQMYGSCPEGTIPIRRTRKEDVLRASSVKAYGKKKIQMPDADAAIDTGHEYAVASVRGDKYYGAKAIFNIWKPNVEQAEFSVAQLWITGDSGTNRHTIEAGWQVYPNLYHDFLPRFFVFWTNDNYQTGGCYNLLCPGFVQISPRVALGTTFNHFSTYGGTQYDVTVLVWKDPKTGNWWLQVGSDLVGYWPSSLVPLVTDGAESVQWGGEVFDSTADGKHTTTQMGSGYFPAEGFGKASFIRNLKIVDDHNKLWTPNHVRTFTYPPKQSGCYDIKLESKGQWQTYFFYGGPGANPRCP